MIPKEEVERIAKLARIELTNKEVEKMQKDLSEILEYFELLKKAKKPTKILAEQNFGAKNLREDGTAQGTAGAAEKIASAFPDKKDGYIKVKNIF